MKGKNNDGKEAKKKSFFAKLFEKLDKKMEEKAKSKTSCCKPTNKEGNSCCS